MGIDAEAGRRRISNRDRQIIGRNRSRLSYGSCLRRRIHRRGMGGSAEIHGSNRAELRIGTIQILEHALHEALIGICLGGAIDARPRDQVCARPEAIRSRILCPPADLIVDELVVLSKSRRVDRAGAAATASGIRGRVHTRARRESASRGTSLGALLAGNTRAGDAGAGNADAWRGAGGRGRLAATSAATRSGRASTAARDGRSVRAAAGLIPAAATAERRHQKTRKDDA